MISREVTHSPHGVAGVLNPARLLDRVVEHESHLERRFIMVALSCPVVVAIVHQPFTLELDDKSSRYTPDFKVTFTDHDSVIVDVKRELYAKEHFDRLSLAKIQLKADGQELLLVTEKQLDANGLSARAMLLMRYGRLQFSEEEALEWKRLIEEHCKGSSKMQALFDHGVSDANIWDLVAKHKLRIPSGVRVASREAVYDRQSQRECHEYFRRWLGIEGVRGHRLEKP